jgi:NAD(P)-dependent dehydrogenase (short-subunit alcohol dehydrogenase family)
MSKLGAVLVTGCGSGIGRATAVSLDKLGWQVFAGVRRVEDGESLRRECSRWLVPLLLDVTEHEQIATAVQTIRTAVGENGLQALINNAGFSADGPLEFFPVDEFRALLEVNTIAPLVVTQAFLPLLRQGHGRVLNISSMAGKFATPFYGPYHASKFALEALSDSWRQELAPHGIPVVLIEPGSIVSEIWEKSARARQARWAEFPPEAEQFYGVRARALHALVERFPPAEVDTAVAVILRALHTRHPRPRYHVGFDALFGLWLARLPDRWRDWLVGKAVSFKF